MKAPELDSRAPRALLVLGIEVVRDEENLREASVPELFAWAFCGDHVSDPVDGILGSLKCDLGILCSAVNTGEIPDETVAMQLLRMQHRAEAAHLIYKRMRDHVDTLLKDAEQRAAESAAEKEGAQ
jgi:hypothetical protein